VGIAEHMGDSLAFLLLDFVTTPVVPRSVLRYGLDSTTSPDEPTQASRMTLKSHTDSIALEIPTTLLNLSQFYPDVLLGKTFVCILDDGKSCCATKIQDHNAENHYRIKFLVELGDCAFDKIMANDTLCECIEDLEDEDLTIKH
jgi:hypothetical protein